jgi:hypothetical protein
MTSKPIRSSFVALCAAVLLVPLGAGAATSAFQPANIPHPGGDDGNLYQDPASYIEGQTIKLTANFPSSDANQVVTIYRESTAGSNDYISTGKTDEANKYGNAYVQYEVTGDQKIFARAGNGHVTEIDELNPEPLGACADTGNFYTTPSTVAEGQSIQLIGNFPKSDANRIVTFLRKLGAGDYEVVGSDEANRYGNAYLNGHEVADGPQTFFAYIAANNTCTEKHPVTPVPSSALLDPDFTPTNNNQQARAKATFAPAQSGTTANLQVKRINGSGWKTIETGKQNSDGVASFDISDPLEVEHEYRAVSNGLSTTNEVTWAGPLLDKNTGVATFHFNSNDGESVNTRSKWFEGEFAIKPGSNSSMNCEPEGVVKDPDKPEAAEMKGRGNYSWSFSKKSFSIKLGDSDNLCDLGKSKKWALVANHYDRSLLRNSVASEVGKVFTNLQWTPQQVPVDLYVNGSYRGAYILIERINFEGGRLDEEELKYADNPADCAQPNITGSYLMEWDFRKGAEFNFGANSHGWIGLKEPEDEDFCSAMGTYINKNYVDIADRDLYDGSSTSTDWLSRIDLASAVDYYIAMEYLKPVDGNMWASVYMYKPRGEKIHFGPLWDFDLAMGSANRAGNVVSPKSWYLRNNLGVSAQQTNKTWFNRLNENPQFREAVRIRWNQIDQDLDEATSGFISTQRNLIDQSAAENYQKWNHGSHISRYQVIKSSWNADVNYLSTWLDDRKNWMNSQLDNND